MTFFKLIISCSVSSISFTANSFWSNQQNKIQYISIVFQNKNEPLSLADLNCNQFPFLHLRFINVFHKTLVIVKLLCCTNTKFPGILSSKLGSTILAWQHKFGNTYPLSFHETATSTILSNYYLHQFCRRTLLSSNLTAFHSLRP
jgi:hypothetical protein